MNIMHIDDSKLGHSKQEGWVTKLNICQEHMKVPIRKCVINLMYSIQILLVASHFLLSNV